MRAGPGAREIEYVTLRVNQDVRVADLVRLSDARLDVIVNGTIVAQSTLRELAMHPPMSGRFTFPIGCSVTEGDEIIAELNSDGFAATGPITIDAELSIRAELEIQSGGKS